MNKSPITEELRLITEYGFNGKIVSDLDKNCIRRNALKRLEKPGLIPEDAVDIINQHPNLGADGFASHRKYMDRGDLYKAAWGEVGGHEDMMENAFLFMAHCAPTATCRTSHGKHAATSLLERLYWKKVWWMTHPYMYKGAYVLAALMCGAKQESKYSNCFNMALPWSPDTCNAKVVKIPYIDGSTGRVRRVDQESYPIEWLNSLVGK